MNFPVNNQVNAERDKPLVYSFSQAINPDSVFSGSVALYETTSNRVVSGVYSYEPSTFTLTFLPDTSLNPNTGYVWYFAGTDTEGVLPLEYEDTTPFTTSFSIGFRTGDVTTSNALGVNPYIEEVDTVFDGQSTLSRSSDLFKIESTIPKLYDSFVDVANPVVMINFSSAVLAGQDFDSLIKLTYEPLLRTTDYYKDRSFNPINAKRIPGEPFPAVNQAIVDKYRMPDGLWVRSVDGKTLTWSCIPSVWNANAFIKVTISKDLLNVDSVKINNAQDESFYFLTDVYPLFTTVDTCLLPLHFLPGFVAEDVVIKFILKHSLEAWHLACKGFSLAYPSRAAAKYVEAAVLLSLLDSKSIVQDINKGKSITLGDLSIVHGFPRNPDSAIMNLRSEYATKLYEAKTELLIQANNYSYKIGVKGGNTQEVYDVYRNRVRSPGDPGYNTNS